MIHCIEHEPQLRRKDGIRGNAQFLDKINLTMQLKCSVSLYLDADTTIHGSLDPLFSAALNDQTGFCATQFNNWKSNGRTVRSRLSELLNVKGIPEGLVKTLTSQEWPSVNGGVWAATPSSPILAAWYSYTKMCGPLFIADERVLHLFMPLRNIGVLKANGRYNSSHKYKDPDLASEDVVIWHYHGDSNVRPKKSPLAFQQWMPIYQHCLDKNIGNMADWILNINNKYLREAEEFWGESK